nr:FtsK/SpoIIIE domain-containing protein [Mycobacterium eburneum]
MLAGDGRGREGVTILDMTGSCPWSSRASTLVYRDGQVLHHDPAVVSGTGSIVERVDNVAGRSKAGAGEPDFLATAEGVSIPVAEGFARKLAPWRPGTKASRVLSAGGDTSTSIDLVSLLNLEDAASFDPYRTWEWARNHRNFLRVPTGEYIDSGRTWYLDLKEDDASDGPHIGLGGSTGSGKSELLRTLVLALCMTHSPEDLVITPADFKGNKTFAGLERLRHVLFVLHNLDESPDRRARLLQVFQGEILRRERLIDSLGEDAKNAEEYRALRRRRPDLGLEPMPAWFIPFDELMQAKREAPELLTMMEIAGTVGRSLDIHMMPVSQTYDESLMAGIDTHIKGRIALTMNNPKDYRPLLGSSNPGALPTRKGVGYFVQNPAAGTPPLRVQTCYVSGPYVPPKPAATEEEVRADKDYFKPVLLSGLPDPAATDIERGYSAHDLPDTELDDLDESEPDAEDVDGDGDGEDTDDTGTRTVMSTIIDVLEGQGEIPRQIWLPELVHYTPVSRLADRYVRESGRPGPLDLVAPCGLVDKPRTHEQHVLAVGLRQNVAILGRPDSGKSFALTALIMAAASIYSPERVQFYCLDNGGGALGQLVTLDHVGDVVTGIGNEYAIERLLNHIQHILRNREAQWSSAGIYDVNTWRRRRFGDEDGPVVDDGYGDVYLVVDGADSFCNQFAEHKATLLSLADRGPKYGLHVVLSARSPNSRGMYQFWELINGWYELKFTDSGESKMGRPCAEAVPNLPGRGLISASGQGAARKDAIAATYTNLKSIPAEPAWHVLFGEPVIETADTGDVLDGAPACEALNEAYPDARPAKRIPVLPPVVRLDSLPPAEPGALRLGQRESDLSTQLWRPGVDSHLFVMGESKCGRSTTLRTVGHQLSQLAEDADPHRKPVIVVFDLRNSLLGVVPGADRYVYDTSQVDEAVQYVQGLLASRSTDEVLTQEQLLARRQHGVTFEGPEIFVLIDDYSDFTAGYSDPFERWEKAAARGAAIGFHLVIGRVADTAAYMAPRGAVAGVRSSGAPVLLMSADPSLVNIVGKTKGQKLPPGRGLYIARDDRMMIQVAEQD